MKNSRSPAESCIDYPLSRCTQIPELRLFVSILFWIQVHCHCTEFPDCCTQNPDEVVCTPIVRHGK
jgi:hypothetical protein